MKSIQATCTDRHSGNDATKISLQKDYCMKILPKGTKILLLYYFEKHCVNVAVQKVSNITGIFWDLNSADVAVGRVNNFLVNCNPMKGQKTECGHCPWEYFNAI